MTSSARRRGLFAALTAALLAGFFSVSSPAPANAGITSTERAVISWINADREARGLRALRAVDDPLRHRRDAREADGGGQRHEPHDQRQPRQPAHGLRRPLLQQGREHRLHEHVHRARCRPAHLPDVEGQLDPLGADDESASSTTSGSACPIGRATTGRSRPSSSRSRPTTPDRRPGSPGRRRAARTSPGPGAARTSRSRPTRPASATSTSSTGSTADRGRSSGTTPPRRR